MKTADEYTHDAESAVDMARGVDFDHAAFLHRQAQVSATLAVAAELREANRLAHDNHRRAPRDIGRAVRDALNGGGATKVGG